MSGDGQLRHLMALRWRMVRSSRARAGFLALASTIPLLTLLAGVAGALLPGQRQFDVLLLAPTAFLAVALVAVLAPLVAGGGNELFPPDQLTALPVTARTEYLGSLVLTPLNLAWTTQVVGLVGLTTFLAEPGPLLALALVTTFAYVACVTLLGHATAWLITGIRQSASGRRVSWVLVALIVTATAVTLVTGRTEDALDAAPTTYVVIALVNGAAGALDWWLSVTGVLVILAAAAFVAGERACTWALKQPGGAATQIDSTRVRRRAPFNAAMGEQLAVDRASVWRSAPLRRGLLVLGLLPGLVAAAAGLAWPSLTLLPGLVAAGAGLLFGVNAFCLDGSGALWLSSLPGRPSVMFWSKARVVAEVCLVAVVITLAAGATRAGAAPTVDEFAALAAATVVVVVRVVATCMHLSITRPHRAELRSPRDTPAPPGVMAAYSVRLAVSTTLTAVLFSALAEVATWHWSVLLGLPMTLFAARRLVRTAAEWQVVTTRARVVTVVATG